MTLDGSPRLGVLVLAVALLSVATVGCLEAIGEQTKETVGPDDRQDPESATDPGDDEASTSARRTYTTALGQITADDVDEGPQRYQIDMTIRSLETDEEGEIQFFLDESESLMIAQVRGNAFETNTDPSATSSPAGPSSTPLDDMEALVVGEVGKTSLLGTSSNLYAIYNETSTGPTGPLDPSTPSAPGQDDDGLDLTGPRSVIQEMNEDPADANVTASETTYQGQPATLLEAVVENETRTLDVRMVVLDDPERPARIDVVKQEPTAEDALERYANITMAFEYGEEAASPYERKAKRAASMAILNTSTTSLLGGDEEDIDTWTVQPSANPGLVDLTDLEIVVSDGSALSEESKTPALRLPAEDGSAENQAARVAYHDVDGDGAVSPGDQITLETKTNGTGLSVALHDEVTGVHVAPGPLVAVPLALLVAATIRYRRD